MERQNTVDKNQPNVDLSAESFTYISTGSDWRLYNMLPDSQVLNNTYVGIRHGQSQANIKGLASGDAGIAAEQYGLTPKGRYQVLSSAVQSFADGLIDADTIVISSDFLRARQTAELVRLIAGVPERNMFVDPRFGERGAGEFEGTSRIRDNIAIAREIIGSDKDDPFHNVYMMESPVEMLHRQTSAIADLESIYEGRTILIASHHDALQVLKTGFDDKSPGYYHDYDRLPNAGIVELKF